MVILVKKTVTGLNQNDVYTGNIHITNWIM